jgi:hypothetical protein
VTGPRRAINGTPYRRAIEPPRRALAQSARDAYQPGPGASLLTCARPDCGARYFNDQPGQHAHRIVFGHPPKSTEGKRP